MMMTTHKKENNMIITHNVNRNMIIVIAPFDITDDATVVAVLVVVAVVLVVCNTALDAETMDREVTDEPVVIMDRKVLEGS